MNSDEYIFRIHNYIHAHLADELTLERIAEEVHLSPWWLSRYYHRRTGIKVMEYVRRQRMRKAAYELLFAGCSVQELAMKYGYSTQDGFCRAFMKFYGVTPGVYKRRNPHMGYMAESAAHQNLWEREEKIMMYELKLLEALKCDTQERKEVLPLVDMILKLAHTARRYGIFELEKEGSKLSNVLLKKGVELIVDGTDPDVVGKILFQYGVCGGSRGKELLENMLIMEGILDIQQGMRPEMIKEILLSLLGGDFIEEAEVYFKPDMQELYDAVAFHINEIEGRTAGGGCSLLESPIGKMNERSLQRLLRELDTDLIGTAIARAGGGIQAKVLNNISLRQAYWVIKYNEQQRGMTDAEVLAAQKDVLEVMKLLVKQGDICV